MCNRRGWCGHRGRSCTPVLHGGFVDVAVIAVQIDFRRHVVSDGSILHWATESSDSTRELDLSREYGHRYLIYISVLPQCIPGWHSLTIRKVKQLRLRKHKCAEIPDFSRFIMRYRCSCASSFRRLGKLSGRGMTAEGEVIGGGIWSPIINLPHINYIQQHRSQTLLMLLYFFFGRI